MTMASRGQIGLIKKLQKQNGLEDAEYREFLKAHTNRTSATMLTVKQAADVIDRLGGGGHKRRYRKKSGNPQVRKIYVLWGLLSEAGIVNRDGLNGFCRRMANIDNVEWLQPMDAGAIIEALKDWCWREDISVDE